MSNIYILQAAELFFYPFILCMCALFLVRITLVWNNIVFPMIVTHAMVSKYNPVKEMP